MKRTILLLTVISLLAVPAMAKKPAGSLGPPTLSPITQDTATIDGIEDVAVYFLDWSDVTGADKYSVDVTAMAVCDTGEEDEYEDPILVEIEMSASFGTSDRLDGGDMGDSDLNIPIADVEALVADLDYYLDLLILFDIIESAGPIEVTAKVKALDPHAPGNKRQNNPFSTSQTVPEPIVP